MTDESPRQASLDLRFEYAWRWFAFHAQQRASMFNYFLVGMGILANAYVLLLDQNLYSLAGGLAVAAALACATFVLLDRRNRQLVHLGENMLREVEADELFRGASQSSLNLGLFGREDAMKPVPAYLKHWLLIEGLEVLLGVGFIVASLHAFVMAN